MSAPCAIIEVCADERGTVVARARDSQRQKVYSAESFLHGGSAWERFETVAEMQAFVDDVLGSAWFRRRWPQVARRGIEVRDGRGRGRACAQVIWGTLVIKMPVWSRSRAIVLHEISHHCADEVHGITDVAAHGWQFAATLLELVAHEMGAMWGDELKKSYKARKVRYKAPRSRKPLTEEQRAVLVERLARARAVSAERIQSMEV